MCGIAACLTPTGDGAAPETAVSRMLAAMRHRGPDQATSFRVHPALSGWRAGVVRLAINDPRPSAMQPFGTEDGTVVGILNGEIYDWRRQRERVRAVGARLRTRCDAELLPHLFALHGTDFAADIEGMFSAIVFDLRRRRVVLARDRMGEKPLYYLVRDGLVLVASDLRGLVASGLTGQELDEQSVAEFFTFRHVPGARTLLRSVRKVPAGCVVTIDPDRGTADTYRYHRPNLWQEPVTDGDAAADELYAALDESVRVRADVPDVDTLAVTLSGGLDSSLIAALTRRNSAGKPIHACCVSVEDDLEDEEVIREVAAAADLRVRVADSGAPDVAGIPDLVAAMGEPIGAGMIGPSSQAYRLAGQVGCRVVLSGEGADELFAGYSGRLAMDALLLRWNDLDASTRSALRTENPKLRAAIARRDGGPPDDPLGRYLWWDDDNTYPLPARQYLLNGATLGRDPSERHRDLDRYSEGASHANRMMWLETQLRLADFMLTIVDRCAMAHSVESRAPFLAPGVVDLALRTPVELKLVGGREKHVLRRAAERSGTLPPRVLWAPKHPFAGPISLWLRDLPPALENLLRKNNVAGIGLLDDDNLRETLKAVRTPRGRAALPRGTTELLYGALLLTLWYHIVVLGTPADEFR